MLYVGGAPLTMLSVTPMTSQVLTGSYTLYVGGAPPGKAGVNVPAGAVSPPVQVTLTVE